MHPHTWLAAVSTCIRTSNLLLHSTKKACDALWLAVHDPCAHLPCALSFKGTVSGSLRLRDDDLDELQDAWLRTQPTGANAEANSEPMQSQLQQAVELLARCHPLDSERLRRLRGQHRCLAVYRCGTQVVLFDMPDRKFGHLS
jgi:hypothetical protein